MEVWKYEVWEYGSMNILSKKHVTMKVWKCKSMKINIVLWKNGIREV